jgi:thioesterase domain-containing protein/acyl carrier protein
VPIGVPGEIYTGGEGVGLGYLNRPDLTAERFLPDPFCLGGPGIMYRSGDLARWREDGTLDFLGRADAQVKIRGVRIELGEIESALTDHPAVREAVVVARGNSATGKALIAYIVTRPGERVPDTAAIGVFLAQRVPSAMVPARVVRLAALPRTATGKFDRGALPEPEPLPAGGASAAAARSPSSPAEIMLAALFADVLGLASIGADDDFYRFGGDSLRAMQLVARVRDAFGVDLSIRDLLAAPNVADLALRIASLARLPVARSPIVTHAAAASGVPLIFLHGDLIGGGAYCRELVRLLDGERPVHLIGPHGVEGGVLPSSIAAMAAQNVAALRAAGIRGPVRLGGFCNGAIVAYEMARELTRTGTAVECVVLVDAVIADRDRLPPATQLAGALRAVLEHTRLRPALHRRRTAPHANASWLDWHEGLLGRWRSVLTRYRPQPYAGRIVLLWSDERAADAVRQTQLWQRFAPDAGTGRVPGGHLSAITQHLAQTSRTVVRHVRGE